MHARPVLQANIQTKELFLFRIVFLTVTLAVVLVITPQVASLALRITI